MYKESIHSRRHLALHFFCGKWDWNIITTNLMEKFLNNTRNSTVCLDNIIINGFSSPSTFWMWVILTIVSLYIHYCFYIGKLDVWLQLYIDSKASYGISLQHLFQVYPEFDTITLGNISWNLFWSPLFAEQNDNHILWKNYRYKNINSKFNMIFERRKLLTITTHIIIDKSSAPDFTAT